MRAVKDSLDWLHNRPDPPPDGYLAHVLEAAARIQEAMAHLADTDHDTATQIAHYAALQLGVPAHVFLIGGRGGSATTV